MPIAITEKKKVYTYKDYASLPQGAPYQLIGGELIMIPSPVPYHQSISKRLEFLMYEFVEKKKKLGEIFDAPIQILRPWNPTRA